MHVFFSTKTKIVSLDITYYRNGKRAYKAANTGHGEVLGGFLWPATYASEGSRYDAIGVFIYD